MPTVLLALSCAIGAGLSLWLARARLRQRRPLVEVQPRCRSVFRHLGLIEAGDFLALHAVIVNGHPDRHVGRVTLGEGDARFTTFIKREHYVPWTVRLTNLLDGFGFVSRSVREARTLQALQREGIGCAEWLAAGEDRLGRAFLLVRDVTDGVELREFLRDEHEPARRVTVLRSLGAALARLHHAGFEHPDLYAKHILVNPTSAAVHVLDWQRSRRRRWLRWHVRARDLAVLHATVTDNLASPRERLLCLRAYLAAAIALRPALATAQAALHLLPRRINFLTLRKLQRRHVREKRQLPVAPASQDWDCLEGDELCVTPALDRAWPGRPAAWLSFDRQPSPASPSLARRWLPLENGGRALLVRRSRAGRTGPFWRRFWGKSPASPEKRLSGLLFRLQRHAVPGPKVLAMGERHAAGGRVDSFLLTEPFDDTVRLDTWLARLLAAGKGPAARRSWDLVRQVGELLFRLHEAGCYLDRADVADVLHVHVLPTGHATLVLSNGDGIRVSRRQRTRLARADVAAVRRCLAHAGCRRTDLRRFSQAYERLSMAPTLASANARAEARCRRGTLPFFTQLGHAQAFSRPQGDGAMSNNLAARSDPQITPPQGLWQRLFRGSRRLQQCLDWHRFVSADWADRIMDVAVTDRFHAKQGRSTGRWVLPGPAQSGSRLTVYLKRHYVLPWWQGLLATLWPGGNWSPALQEWEHLEWARRQGVPVPRVVAAGEYIGPWGRLQSFLAVEELTDMLPLHEAIPLAALQLDPATFRRWKRSLVAEMARLTRMLHDRRCFHKDLYLCHFYIARSDTLALPVWRGRVFLIDLHRLAHHRWTWRIWQLKDLAQLLYSSDVAGIDARDQLAYWAAYRGTGPRRGSDRWLRRWVLLKWQRYRRHNARHKLTAA